MSASKIPWSEYRTAAMALSQFLYKRDVVLIALSKVVSEHPLHRLTPDHLINYRESVRESIREQINRAHIQA